MLGSFEDLEKDIEKFKNNVIASSELVNSLNSTIDAIKAQTVTISEQTAAVEHISADMLRHVAETTDGAVKRMSDSSQSMTERIIAKDTELQSKLESVPCEMKASLLDHEKEITSKNEEYLQACAAKFENAQQEYLGQLKDNQASLDACRKQLAEAHSSFIKKAEELDLNELQHSVEQLKVDMAKKLNIVTIISIVAAVAAIASIFIK